MNINELEHALRELGVPKLIYSLHGRKDERVCLEQRDSRWFVCFYERGQEKLLGSFDTESEACEFMLSELKYEI